MVDPVEYIFSFCYFLARLFHLIRKAASMALCSNPAAHASPRPPPWKRLTDTSLNVPPKRAKEASDLKPHRVEDELVKPENLALGRQESTPKAEASNEERVSLSGPQDFNLKFDVSTHAEYENENLDLGRKEECGRPVVPAPELDSLLPRKVQEEKVALKTRKRPPRLVIPAESCANSDFNEASKMQNMVQKELEVEGSGYCVASRRGHRLVMEDGYEVITHIHGDSKQAFFGVFDGHGGRAAVDFVSEKLGKNIITALDKLEKGENQLELALRAGYLTTDKEFLSKGFSSGACAATVLLKDGELHAANVGDCRVVISQKGVAIALTSDHRAGREDERNRIERSGGYVSCRNGVWRVQDSLAVSRAIGDRNMKEWIISEPETRELRLTPDYEFLIVASDGLWDKVTNQEAVDVVLRHKNPMKSCKDLVDLSCNRGNRDDITVMVVDLQNFVQTGT